jgi:putative endonuclease
MMMFQQKESIGKKGETLACKFLKKKGFRFLDQNFHAQGGEIDLVMYDKIREEYIFVEVKTRTNQAFGDIWESIPPQKIQKILKAGERYLLKKTKGENMPHYRIDAVFIVYQGPNPVIEHLENIGL